MQAYRVPIEICVLIALSRPDAYNKLSRACKKLHNVLKAHNDVCMKRWIRRYNWETRDIHNREVRIYAGICPNGALHGEYKIFDIANNKLTDVYNYRFGVLHGPAYEIDNYGYRTSCSYDNGALHGTYKLTGGGYKLDLFKLTYVHGKRNGLYISQYISGGRRWEIPYVDDKIHGEATYWYVNGLQMCCRENWRNGVLHGKRIFYDHRGWAVLTEEYNNGVMTKHTGYQSNVRDNPRLLATFDIAPINPTTKVLVLSKPNKN